MRVHLSKIGRGGLNKRKQPDRGPQEKIRKNKRINKKERFL